MVLRAHGVKGSLWFFLRYGPIAACSCAHVNDPVESGIK